MWMLSLFVLCVIALLGSLYFVKSKKVKKESIILGIIGFVAGYAVEVWGVTTGAWEYSNDETNLFMVSDIPFEVLFMYGVGLFLMSIFIHCVIRYYPRDDKLDILMRILPVTGVFFFGISLIRHEIAWGVGLSFLALWGLMISERPHIPLLVGLVAFFADFFIEGTLTYFTSYSVWTIGVSTAFMLIGITIAGVLTRKKCNGKDDFCFVYE
jgi:uncharacterized membrane protein YoaT (DUF817 family)